MRQYLLCLILILASCVINTRSERDGAPSTNVQTITAPNPIPRIEKKSKYGNKSTYTVKGKKYHVLKSAVNYHRIGIASWYGTKFHGRLTSSREPYNMFALTAASKELPIPCYIKVKNLENGKTVIVRVNDRGPFKPGRIMDLSYAAAQKIGMLKKGTAKVELRFIAGKIKSQHHEKRHNSISLGLYRNQAYAKKLQRKISKHPILKNNSLIKKDEFYQLIVGPIARKKIPLALKALKKLRLKAKTI